MYLYIINNFGKHCDIRVTKDPNMEPIFEVTCDFEVCRLIRKRLNTLISGLEDKWVEKGNIVEVYHDDLDDAILRAIVNMMLNNDEVQKNTTRPYVVKPGRRKGGRKNNNKQPEEKTVEENNNNTNNKQQKEETMEENNRNTNNDNNEEKTMKEENNNNDKNTEEVFTKNEKEIIDDMISECNNRCKKEKYLWSGIAGLAGIGIGAGLVWFMTDKLD